jgi:hypothetical protein
VRVRSTSRANTRTLCRSTTISSRNCKITEGFAGIDVNDLGAERHIDIEILARCARTVFAGATTSVLGFEATPKPEIRERIGAIVDTQQDAATVTAIAAVGTALGNEFLAAKADGALAAVAGFDANDGLVNEFHLPDVPKTKKPRQAGLWLDWLPPSASIRP